MKGSLKIDFEITPHGRSVRVTGHTELSRGQVVDVTNDVMFCLGLLNYAKGILWQKEQKALQPVVGEGLVEIPEPASVVDLAVVPKK